jgi:hypothetical protein
MTEHDDPAAARNRPEQPETLEEFKNSFFYGSRSNLNAKFLASLAPTDAADVIAGLLDTIDDVIDRGDTGALIERFIAAQARAYEPSPGESARFAYGDGPFTAPAKPLAESRVALVTSSGHFVAGDDPQPFDVVDMTQAEAEARISEFLRAAPTLSSIPSNTSPTDLRVRHGGYPVAAVAADHQVALPIGHLRQLADQGRIGALADRAYSFVGAAAQLRLRDHVAPEWAVRLQTDEVDLALLVPV